MGSFSEEKSNKGGSTAFELQNRHKFVWIPSEYQHYVLEYEKLILNYNSNAGKIPEEQVT